MLANCAGLSAMGLVHRPRGFSGLAFFHQNNGLAPEWLLLRPRKINRLSQFSRTDPSEICAYFTMSASREKHASKYADYEVVP